MTPFLSEDLGATKVDFSLASGAFFISFALCQFPVGVCLDRYGPRWTVSVLFGVSASGAMLFALATAPWMMVVAMAVIGAGCSAVLMGAVFLIACNYPPARMAAYTSFVLAFGSVGNIVSASPLALAAQAFGWRNVVLAVGMAALLIAVAIALAVHNPSRPANRYSSGLAGYLELLRIRLLWPLFPLVLLGYTAVGGIRGLWVGTYLHDTFQLGPISIGNVSVALSIAMVLGTFLYGILDAYFKNHKRLIICGQLICASALIVLSLNVDGDILTVTIALIVVGISGVGFGVIMAHGRAFLPPHLVGRGITLINFCTIAGSGIMQLVAGVVVTEAMRPDDPGYAYAVLFGFYAGTLLLVLFIYSFSRKDRGLAAAVVNIEGRAKGGFS